MILQQQNSVQLLQSQKNLFFFFKWKEMVPYKIAVYRLASYLSRHTGI